MSYAMQERIQTAKLFYEMFGKKMFYRKLHDITDKIMKAPLNKFLKIFNE